MKVLVGILIGLSLVSCKKEVEKAELAAPSCAKGELVAHFNKEADKQLVVCGVVFKKVSDTELEMAGFDVYEYTKEGLKKIYESASVQERTLKLEAGQQAVKVFHNMTLEEQSVKVELFNETISCGAQGCTVSDKNCSFEKDATLFVDSLKGKKIKELLQGEQGHKKLLAAALSGHQESYDTLVKAGDLGLGGSLQRSLLATQKYLALLKNICQPAQ